MDKRLIGLLGAIIAIALSWQLVQMTQNAIHNQKEEYYDRPLTKFELWEGRTDAYIN